MSIMRQKLGPESILRSSVSASRPLNGPTPELMGGIEFRSGRDKRPWGSHPTRLTAPALHPLRDLV